MFEPLFRHGEQLAQSSNPPGATRAKQQPGAQLANAAFESAAREAES